ncbi:Transient receptor potential cation channel subfamily M member 2 [Plecturocebus cupreus]
MALLSVALPWARGQRAGLFWVNTLTSSCHSLLPDSYTFQQVQEHTDQIWKFQRHDLIEEYHGRPPAPPPFILLSHLQLFIKRVVLKTPAKRHKQLSKPAPIPLLRLPPTQVHSGWRWSSSFAQNLGRSAGVQATQAAGLLLALKPAPTPKAPDESRLRGPPPEESRIPCLSPTLAENKLEKNEEAALLSWEIYLKENYLQHQQFQQKQRPEQKIEDISNKCGARAGLGGMGGDSGRSTGTRGLGQAWVGPLAGPQAPGH